MRRTLIRLNLFVRRTICRVFGHLSVPGSFGSVGVHVCRRCLQTTLVKTARGRRTKGDVERMMREATPAGGTFHYINWKKNLAHFTDSEGKPLALPLGTLTA